MLLTSLARDASALGSNKVEVEVRNLISTSSITSLAELDQQNGTYIRELPLRATEILAMV